ncbi:hypothetical protein RRG08_000196 [Elysia crispata]|uniref:Uncharacterized protein n=1 Tax=Elysia crispata TaxID=231223 RepID=A0AAE0YVA7_9GAST|nr:hypothetical protein RRG08_000196 [Elysia crispata]
MGTKDRAAEGHHRLQSNLFSYSGIKDRAAGGHHRRCPICSHTVASKIGQQRDIIGSIPICSHTVASKIGQQRDIISSVPMCPYRWTPKIGQQRDIIGSVPMCPYRWTPKIGQQRDIIGSVPMCPHRWTPKIGQQRDIIGSIPICSHTVASKIGQQRDIIGSIPICSHTCLLSYRGTKKKLAVWHYRLYTNLLLNKGTRVLARTEAKLQDYELRRDKNLIFYRILFRQSPPAECKCWSNACDIDSAKVPMKQQPVGDQIIKTGGECSPIE